MAVPPMAKTPTLVAQISSGMGFGALAFTSEALSRDMLYDKSSSRILTCHAEKNMVAAGVEKPGFWLDEIKIDLDFHWPK